MSVQSLPNLHELKFFLTPDPPPTKNKTNSKIKTHLTWPKKNLEKHASYFATPGVLHIPAVAVFYWDNWDILHHIQPTYDCDSRHLKTVSEGLPQSCANVFPIKGYTITSLHSRQELRSIIRGQVCIDCLCCCCWKVRVKQTCDKVYLVVTKQDLKS